MSNTRSLALVLLLAACTSPVEQQASGVDIPALWQRLTAPAAEEKAEAAALTSTADATVEQAWWQQFNDPVLNALVGEVLANNKTLAIAQTRVEEARANRRSTLARLLPQLDGSARATRENPGALFGDKPYTTQQAQLDASWELDLFGKNQARAAQAAALLASEEATVQGVRVALLAELARTYFELREAALQVAITQKNIEKQERTFRLTEAQYDGAFASRLDVERAGSQLAVTKAQLPLWQTQHDAAHYRLQVLLGKPPGTLAAALAEAKPQPALPARIVVAAPAEVLANRPDIRAAERQFAASIAGADAATRELFPTIGLTAFYGAQDYNDQSANPWSVGANLTQPILNFGRVQAGIDAADAREEQAFLTYQQTLLEALADMETALSRYLHETTRNRALTEAATRSNKAASLAKQQYREGESGLLDLLIVERDALAAESAQATSDALLRQQLVAIYAAAGGGWAEVAEPAKEQDKAESKEPAKASAPAEGAAAAPAPATAQPQFTSPPPFAKAR